MRNKTIRVVITSIVVLIIIFTVSACGIPSSNESSTDMYTMGMVVETLKENPEQIGKIGRFIVIDAESLSFVLEYTMYDPETYVMYVYIVDYNMQTAALSPLLNTDGTPMIYYEAMPAVG